MVVTVPGRTDYGLHGQDVRERPRFTTVKIYHSLSTGFDGSVYGRLDQLRVLADLETNGCATWISGFTYCHFRQQLALHNDPTMYACIGVDVAILLKCMMDDCDCQRVYVMGGNIIA